MHFTYISNNFQAYRKVNLGIPWESWLQSLCGQYLHKYITFLEHFNKKW